MSKLRVGMIGVGGIATSRHLPALLTLSDKIELTAVSDINVERAKEVGKEYLIPTIFENYHDVLKEVDAVFISTPNKFHSEITIAALNAGVHVFCEKPMAMTVKECDEMIEAANQSGKILSIGYHYRYMKESQAAKKMMLENEIGNPLVVRVQALRRRKVPGWGVFTNKELQGGGSLIDYGCHLIDLAMWLMGHSRPLEVSGSVYNMLSKMPDQVNLWGKVNHETFDVDDHVTGYIKFENGSSMLLEASWAANVKEDAEVVNISGDKGGINVFPLELNNAKYGMLFDSQAVWIPGDENPGIPQAKNFIEACLGETELVVKPEEAREVSRIIEALYESGRSGQSVRLD